MEFRLPSLRQYLLFSLLLMVCVLPLPAQPLLIPAAETHIPLGPEKHQIGVEKAEGEDWKPLFFAVDVEGNVHVPDFYKDRIAVFSRSGSLIRSSPISEGISPRMNYFSLAYFEAAGRDFRYITYDGFTLHCIGASGELLWKYRFPFGTFPGRILSSAEGVFFVPSSASGPEQSALVFDPGSGKIPGVLRVPDSGESVPAVSAAGGRVFPVNLAAAGRLYAGRYRLPSMMKEEEAVMYGLHSVFPDGESLWQKREAGVNTFLLYGKDGGARASGSIADSQSAGGVSFSWTAVSANSSVYRNSFSDEALTIEEYRLSPLKAGAD